MGFGECVNWEGGGSARGMARSHMWHALGVLVLLVCLLKAFSYAFVNTLVRHPIFFILNLNSCKRYNFPSGYEYLLKT